MKAWAFIFFIHTYFLTVDCTQYLPPASTFTLSVFYLYHSWIAIFVGLKLLILFVYLPSSQFKYIS